MELLTYIALGLLTTSTVAQRLIFSDLPPAPYYPDGEFLVPKPATKNGGVINQVYVQGSMMNVTWKTKYPSINLFIGPDDPNGGPTQLLTGYSGNSYMWTIDDMGNNNFPFILHFTNAEGSEDDQLHGGVWAGYFWIADLPLAARISSSSASAASAKAALTATTSSTMSTVTSTTSSSSSSATSLTASPGATSSITTTSMNRSAQATQTLVTTAPAIAPNPTTSTTADDSKSSPNSVVLAAGIGIGSGVLLIAVAAGFMFWFWRRQKKNAQEKKVLDFNDMAHHGQASELPPNPPGYVQDPRYEAPADHVYFEAPGDHHDAKEVSGDSWRAEAPGCFRREPQELPANDWQSPNVVVRHMSSATSHSESWRTKPHPPVPPI